MESIERLRKMDDEMLVPLGNGQYVPDHSHNDIADQIEAEIAERYMELPVDANGVPIHVGDLLQLGDTCSEVMAFEYRPHDKLPWSWLTKDGEWHNTAFTQHVKPRTIEDVLEDFGIECDERYPIRPRTELIAEYANEIRGLL